METKCAVWIRVLQESRERSLRLSNRLSQKFPRLDLYRAVERSKFPIV